MFENIREKSLVISQIAVVLILVILVAIGFFALQAMNQSAGKISQAKDVVADILPPPLYLIEAQLLSYELLAARSSDRHALITKMHRLKKDYDDRNQYWVASNLDQLIKSSLLGEQHNYANMFWDEALVRFLPSIQANNLEAARNSAQIMRTYYETHRKGVDATVALGNKYAAERFESLSMIASQSYWYLGGAALLGLILTLVWVIPTQKRTYHKLRVAIAAAAALAKRLDTLLDTSPDPMISVTPDGHIVRVNLMAQQFFGYTNDEMLSMKIESLIPEKFRVKHVGHRNGFFDNPKNRSMGDSNLNLQALTRDGREPFVDLSLSYSGEGADRLVTVSLRDMTEKVRVHEEIAKSRAAKLETINSMTAGIAHDFNNILGSMLGYSELSLVMLKQGLHEKVIAYQEEILKSGGRVKDLVKQMMTYSRMMPNTNEKNATAILLAPIVKEVISSHRADIKSGILLDFSIANYSLSATILPSNLQLILSNLIKNAREAMGERGKIDISLSEQSLTATLCDSCNAFFSGRFVKISVSDEGSGITEANLQKIFDPFFTTKNRSMSAGMGLSIVHGLVHVQGGHIIVEAKVEAGTTISVLLPFANAE